MTRTENITKKLKELGYEANQKALNIISECNDWYTGEESQWHSRKNINGDAIEVDTLNFAKRLCADDANLCEVVEVNASEDQAQYEFVNTVLKDNRFEVMYRDQLERMSANGTEACYVYIENAELYEDKTVRNGTIRLNYCDADNVIPLTVINKEVTECAFAGSNIVDGKREDVLVVFRFGEDGRRYVANSFYWLDDKEQRDRETELQLGEVKPFAFLYTAEVNNVKNMDGYGYPKLKTSIPVLKILDLAFTILHGDLNKGDKLLFINELLACIKQGADGKPMLSKEQRDLFILLGDKLPNQPDVIQEYNPTIRISDITAVFETTLSILSMSFGYGTKKYTFEDGRVVTATEYAGSKQDQMQDLNKQRGKAKEYIKDIVEAVLWFSNTFNGTEWKMGEEVQVDFDDSYVTDRETELERMRTDAQLFDIPELKVWYLMRAYNLSEDEATALVLRKVKQEDDEGTKDANLGEE